MPYVLKPNKLFVKDPEGTGFLPQNVVTDQATSDAVAEIEQASAEEQAAIEAKGAQTRASVPEDYTTLSDNVGDLKNAYDDSKVSAIIPNNILIGTKCFDNTSLLSASGETDPNSNYWITDYIDVSDAIAVIGGVDIYKTCWYDAEKNFTTYTGKNIKAPVPSGSKYARLQFEKTVIPFEQRLNFRVYFYSRKHIFEYEISDNVFVESSGVDIVNACNGIMSMYVSSTGNNLVFSANWVSYIFDAARISKLSYVSCFANNLDFYQVSFYSDGGIRDAYFISGLQFYTSISDNQQKNIEIPSTAKYVVISNRKASGAVQIIGRMKDNQRSLFSNYYRKALQDTGNEYDDVNFWVTDFVSINSNKPLIVSKYNIYKVLFYDNSNQVLSVSRPANKSNLCLVNTDATKYRICYNTSVSDFYDATNYAVCVNGTLTDANPDTIFGNAADYFADISYKSAFNVGLDGWTSYYGERISLENKCMRKNLTYSGAGQDACQYKNFFFAFSATGNCTVVNTDTEAVVGGFNVDGHDTIKPHCNSAVFSNAIYSSGDVFPLLYINAYNTSGLPKGTCYVHRILTDENGLPNGTQLIQTITIGFANEEPWTDGHDIRPYGNFVIDTDNGYLYAYTLKDNLNVTRFFKFAIPGTSNSTIALTLNDVLEQFDVDYMPYIQGNTYHNGMVYVVSGYGNAQYPGFLNVINLYSKRLVTKLNFLRTFGLSIEPEFVNVVNNKLITGQTTAMSIEFI